MTYCFQALLISIIQQIKVDSKLVTERTVLCALMLLHYLVASFESQSLDTSLLTQFDKVELNSTNLFVNAQKLCAPSQCNLIQLLLYIKHEQKEFLDIKPLAQKILDLFSSKDKACQELISSYLSEDQLQSGEGSQSDLKQKAEARKQAMLAQFAAQRQAFQKNLKMEDFGKDELEESVEVCCLCKQACKNEQQEPIGLISYGSRSKFVHVMNRNHKFNPEFPDCVSSVPVVPSIGTSDLPQKNWGVQLVSCGHLIHVECFQNYFRSLQVRHANQQPYEGQSIISLNDGEFLCPTVRFSVVMWLMFSFFFFQHLVSKSIKLHGSCDT